MIQFSFSALLYFFRPMCPCAVVAVNRAVICWTQGAWGTRCSVCALAMGTSTPSDRHLLFWSNILTSFFFSVHQSSFPIDTVSRRQMENN